MYICPIDWWDDLPDAKNHLESSPVFLTSWSHVFRCPRPSPLSLHNPLTGLTESVSCPNWRRLCDLLCPLTKKATLFSLFFDFFFLIFIPLHSAKPCFWVYTGAVALSLAWVVNYSQWPRTPEYWLCQLKRILCYYCLISSFNVQIINRFGCF